MTTFTAMLAMMLLASMTFASPIALEKVSRHNHRDRTQSHVNIRHRDLRIQLHSTPNVARQFVLLQTV